MLKLENKKMLQICLAVVAIFTALVSVVPTEVMVSYAKNDPRNQACYNAGFADGQKIIHIVKPCSTSAASMARLTIKDSCQVVYLL